MSGNHPSIIFGCANIGKSYETREDVLRLLEALQECGINHLDTAVRYPPTSPGMSEKLLGEAGAGKNGFIIDSKVLISGDGKGSLEKDNIAKSIANSFDSLNVGKLNILYCHGPDTQTPIKEQAAAFDRHYRDGEFTHEWFDIADEYGYVKPTFYQGQFNLVCQGYADELLPFLRQHDMHFVAFSPLAGGFLTGKLTQAVDAKDLVGTRFEVSDSNPFGKAARHWYDKPSMHVVSEKLKALAESSGMPMEGLALRWLVYHSALKEGDSIILGASKPQQVLTSMKQIHGGPLDIETVAELDSLWTICASDAQSIVSY